LKPHPTVSWIEQLFHRAAAARVVILFFFHAVVFATCYALATLVRFDFFIPGADQETLKASLLIVVGVQLFVGLFFGFYRGWWRYVGIVDVVRLVAGLATATFLLLLTCELARRFNLPVAIRSASRGALLIDFAFALLSLFGARLVVRVSRDRFSPAHTPLDQRRLIIIGAGDAGEALAREFEHRPQIGRVVAFVDDHRAKWGSFIRGIKVTGPISNISQIANDMEADEALIAIPSASGKRVREIIHELSAAGLQFKTMPGIDQLVSGKVQVSQLRPVNFEDLIRRQRIELPGDPVRHMFRGKRVVVTGAGGTIGSELSSQIMQFDPECLVLMERSEYALYEARKRIARETGDSSVKIVNALIDVQQTDTVRKLLQDVRPQIVIHAAAHKHVPLGEENPPEYLRNNALATRALAEMCEQSGVERFVLISTDKAINPTSVMGASKRAAEILLLDIVRRSSTSTMKATAVRFGNVMGSSGSVIPLFMEQIARGGPVTVTDPEVTRYFLRTSEAVSLVLQAATLGNRGDVFMLDMGEPLKIVDLARDLIRLSNHTEEEIPIVFSGLRPGEKLFEEIRLDGESIQPTVHPQIVVTNAPQPDAQLVAQWASRAGIACERGDNVVPLLRELIPEYYVPAADALAAPLPTLPIRRQTPAAKTAARVQEARVQESQVATSC
jgi:FlaA1/EpsC-like NDP-sugar epimerase